MDGILINFSKNKISYARLKQTNFVKNDFHVGSYHLYKIQGWFVIYVYLFNKNSKNNSGIKLNGVDLNLKKIYLKKRMNYKFLIKIDKMNLCINIKKASFKILLEKRLEFFFNATTLYFGYSNLILKRYLTLFMMNNDKNLKKLVLFSIYFLDLNFTYKGWRHLQNLPVRGQRTWTNGVSALSNKILKNHKLFVLKNFLNITNLSLVSSYLTIEYINLLWKLQWTSEWLELKKKRLFFLKKKTKNLKMKIDEQSILQELASLRAKFLKKKTKTSIKGGYVALGFEPGFGSIFVK